MNNKSLSFIFEERIFESSVVSEDDRNCVLRILGNPSFELSKKHHLIFEMLFKEKYSKILTDKWIKEYCEIIGIRFPNYLKTQHWHKHIFKKDDYVKRLKVYDHKVGHPTIDYELLIQDTIEEMKQNQSYLLEHENSIDSYRRKCSFIISHSNLSLIDGYDLLRKHGWYNKNNVLGMTKDHKVSIKYGFTHRIPPYIISHPANCEFMPMRINSSKGNSCSLTLEELENKISNWNIQ